MRHVGRLIGWLLTYVYALGMLAMPIVNCTQGSDDAWAITLFLETPLLVAGLGLIWLGRPWHLADRLLGAPHIATVALGLFIVAPFLMKVTLGGQHVCQAQVDEFPGLTAAWWHPFWAPVELVCLAMLGLTVFLTWRKTQRVFVPRAA